MITLKSLGRAPYTQMIRYKNNRYQELKTMSVRDMNAYLKIRLISRARGRTELQQLKEFTRGYS